MTPKTGPHRKLLLGGLAVVIVLLAIFVAFQWRSPKSGASPDLGPAPVLAPFPMTVTPGIHLLGGLVPGTAYVVETSKGLVLIDSGIEADCASVIRQMDYLELDWKRLHAILLTHGHADHCLGAEHLRAGTGARIYAGKGDAKVLRNGGPREALFSTISMPQVKAHPTTVDRELHGDEVLDFGDARFKVLTAPGHTPGSVCYLLERHDLRVLFSGDVIMKLSSDPRSSALGTYSAYLAPRYRGDARSFLESLRRLQKLPAPDLVLPGHPSSDNPPQSPSMSQQRWNEILDRGIREMEALVAHYESDGAGFLDGNPKKILTDVYYLGDFKDVAVYGFFASSKFFVVDAPGGPGLADFLTERLQRLGVKPSAPAAILLTACGPGETAGLKDLLAKQVSLVIAPDAGVAQIRTACPAGTRVLAASELAGKNWFPVSSMPLAGRGQASTAYEIKLANKTLLFSGRMPIRLTQDAVLSLFADFSRSNGAVSEYRESLNSLARLRPNVWLPAVPADGQNANLYVGDWEAIIASNHQLLR